MGPLFTNLIIIIMTFKEASTQITMRPKTGKAYTLSLLQSLLVPKHQANLSNTNIEFEFPQLGVGMHDRSTVDWRLLSHFPATAALEELIKKPKSTTKHRQMNAVAESFYSPEVAIDGFANISPSSTTKFPGCCPGRPMLQAGATHKRPSRAKYKLATVREQPKHGTKLRRSKPIRSSLHLLEHAASGLH